MSNLEAVTDSGGVFISNGVTAAVDLNIGLVWTVFDDIELVNAGSILLVGGNVEGIFADDGDVLLQANGAMANVELAGGTVGVDANSGDITILAGQHIFLGNPVTDENGGIRFGGNLLLNATRDIILDEGSRVVAKTETSMLTGTAGGDISILSSDGTTGAGIRTLGGAVVLTTGAGARLRATRADRCR